MLKLLFPISIAIHFTYTAWKLRKSLHILQLNSYMSGRYWGWVRKNYAKILSPRDFLPALSVVPLFFHAPALASLMWISGYAYLLLTRRSEKEKKELVFTARAKRLFATALLLLGALSAAGLYATLSADPARVALLFTALIILNVGSFGLMLIANAVMMPVESTLNRWYYNDARQRIRQMPRLTVIGITGSFGKTSTKYILHRVLSEAFNVLMTPESYNTPMGVTKVVRTSLKPTHDIFIVEMGAKQRGDIRELCRLVLPRLGILTAIGEQHLETFKSIETIKQTKNELVESLPENGVAFLNMDNEHIRELARRAKVKTIYYGIEAAGLHYSAQDIRYTATGSGFTVVKYDGSRAAFQTRLLGKHNIYNILAATAVAGELGMDLSTIASVVKTVEPVPHRLELKRSNQPITIIDDAFNSNPTGSHMALDVLKEMTGKKKILVTPGMVELGEKEYELNKVLGTHAAEVCDYVILVGRKQTAPIQDGLESRNYPGERCYIAKDFYDANQHLQTIVQPGDVVLFENDLPDTYSE